MRKSMKESGIATVIIVSLAAMAFLPRRISSWVVFAAIAIFVVKKGFAYYTERKNVFSDLIKKIKARFNKTEIIDSESDNSQNEPVLDFAITQLTNTVTAKLKKVFPNIHWYWCEAVTQKIFTEGGRIRIVTMNAKEFEAADVVVDAKGNVDIEMIRKESITKLAKAEEKKADTGYTMDVETWYSRCAQKVLTDIITELNAEGTKKLRIKENGSLVVGKSRHVGKLKAFPNKNLWKKVVTVLRENGLKAFENENNIELSW